MQWNPSNISWLKELGYFMNLDIKCGVVKVSLHDIWCIDVLGYEKRKRSNESKNNYSFDDICR